MKNIGGKISLGIALFNIFMIQAVKICYEWMRGYEASFGEIFLLEIIRIVIAVIALIVGGMAVKKNQKEGIWAKSGMVLAIIEILFATGIIICQFLFGGSMEIIG